MVDRQFPEQTLYTKFLLIKLLKDEKLNADEITLIGNMTYKPLKFDKDGVLVN